MQNLPQLSLESKLNSTGKSTVPILPIRVLQTNLSQRPANQMAQHDLIDVDVECDSVHLESEHPYRNHTRWIKQLCFPGCKGERY